MRASLWLGVVLCAATLLSAQTNSKPATRPKKVAQKSAAVSADEVNALRNALTAQQRQMEQQRQQMDQLKSQLQQLLDTTQQANATARKAQSSVDQAQTTAAQAQQSATEAQHLADQASSNAVEAKTAVALVNTRTQEEGKQLSALESLVGRFRFSGDVRLRGEAYSQQGVPDRNRARIRVRFGLDGQLNEDFNAGIALATGTLGDPTTTNETITNVFDRKTIALDRGFITYNPIAHHWFSLTGGKFAFTWQRTSVTFDPDLNPEGFNQKASFDFSGPIKNVTIQGLELLYNEANGKPGIPSQDSYAVGGQASAKLQFGPWTATPSFLTLKWNRPDAILQESAFAVAATSTGFQPATPKGGTTPSPITGIPVPGEGQGCAKGTHFASFPPCVFAPNGMTNATYVDSKGVAHFYSGYNYADFILNNQIQTGFKRLPVNLLLEFLDNLDAEAHPLNTKGKVISSLGSQNKEYGFDFSIGQVKNKNDIQLGYSWYREEQDAAIASFVESDQRAPTNILQNRIYALWKLRANTLASFTWWRGRALNTNLENNVALFNNYNGSVPTIAKAGQQEPYLNRLQFDLIYTF
ncbi:MAG TPA: putative porin [Terriglobales bacterium]|nr:putative porin [Terriglobales bacterium]